MKQRVLTLIVCKAMLALMMTACSSISPASEPPGSKRSLSSPGRSDWSAISVAGRKRPISGRRVSFMAAGG